MNILFIIKKEIHSAQEPLGVLYLSAVLKRNGYNVYLSDSSPKKFGKIIREKSIRIVAISCMNTDYRDYLSLSQKVKQEFPEILIVWGGPTPTYNPGIINESAIDIICRGEGEYAFLELVNKLEREENITDIKNLWIKQNSTVYKNNVRPLVTDLDTLPLPDRNLTKVFPQFKYSSIKFVMAGRGCPFNCSYCFNCAFKELYMGKGAIIRTRSVDNLIIELKDLKKNHGAKFFFFLDDIFPFKEDWLNEFVEKYSKEIKIPFTIVTSAVFAKENFVRLMKEAGCVSMYMAIEIGNEELRRKILNKPITNQQILEAAKNIKKYGLGLSSCNMIGIPYAKFEDELKTLDLNLEAKVDTPYVLFCLPFLNTKLGQIAKDGGFISEGTEFQSYFEKIPIKVENKEKLEKFSYFFPIIVSYPFLRRYLNTLLKTPIPRLALRLSKDIINGYNFKQKIVPVKPSFKEFWITLYSFMTKRFSK